MHRRHLLRGGVGALAAATLGYTATVIYATGDSIDPAVSGYKNDGTDDNFGRRITPRTPMNFGGPAKGSALLKTLYSPAGFFTRGATDNAARSAQEKTAFARIGLKQNVTGGQRWDTSQTGASTDGTDDFRNTHITFGWVVEIDPYDLALTPVKHTGSVWRRFALHQQMLKNLGCHHLAADLPHPAASRKCPLDCPPSARCPNSHPRWPHSSQPP